METKVLTEYDMKRVLSLATKEYGKIERGEEEQYNPQIDYIEHKIYELFSKTYISDYELQEVIPMVIYDLKGYIDNKLYDYTNIRDEKLNNFAKDLEMLFNPFINPDIKINKKAKEDLKGLFTLPIICLVRINASIEFWRKAYGKDGYFKMLREMVVPIVHIGNFSYALEEEYLINN